jgi:hypothetical protein
MFMQLACPLTYALSTPPQRARQEGRFDRIQGRGQPLKQVVEERNPFIAREEFLMNRIVQRQGAAPAWVEIQQGMSILYTH